MTDTNTKYQPTLRRRVDLEGPDFYPTPAWATEALLNSETFAGNTWEPACGDGAMSKVLKERGLPTFSTDLHECGYAQTGVDFLVSSPVDIERSLVGGQCGNMTDEPVLHIKNIITNPPFNLAEAFIHRALGIAEHKVAMLLRLAFLETVGRRERLFDVSPPARVLVFSKRVSFFPKGHIKSSGGTVAHAWFVWDKIMDEEGRTEIKWIP